MAPRCEIHLIGLSASPAKVKTFTDKDKEDFFYTDLEMGVTSVQSESGTDMRRFDECHARAKHSVVFYSTEVIGRKKLVRRLCDLHFEIMAILSEPQTVGPVDDEFKRYHLPVRARLRKNRI